MILQAAPLRLNPAEIFTAPRVTACDRQGSESSSPGILEMHIRKLVPESSSEITALPRPLCCWSGFNRQDGTMTENVECHSSLGP
jgi:hypothetical protein